MIDVAMHNNEKKNASRDDSEQPGHLPTLNRVKAEHMKKTWVLKYLSSAQQIL